MPSAASRSCLQVLLLFLCIEASLASTHYATSHVKWGECDNEQLEFVQLLIAHKVDSTKPNLFVSTSCKKSLICMALIELSYL
jgi:hypothetical protein